MSRRDLPKGYGGWQAIDSTPQEQSDGKAFHGCVCSLTQDFNTSQIRLTL